MVRVMVAAALLLGACAGGGGAEAGGCDPARPHPAGRFERTLVHDGLERSYALSVPAAHDGRVAAPLVVNLHAFGATADSQDTLTGLPEAAGARGYVVASPQALPVDLPLAERLGATSFWNVFGGGKLAFGDRPLPGAPDAASLGAADDVGFLARLIDTLALELCVDESAVFVTGHSNGAGMATTLGCALGGRISAIAPVAGVNLTSACPGRARPWVLAVHGDADGVVRYEGDGLLGLPLGNPSVEARMAAWAARHGCTAGPETDSTSGVAVVSRWLGCEAGARVELWTLTGHDHSWPRRDPIDATGLVLDFFDERRAAAER